MLSPELATLQRTSSEPDVSVELGKRTLSNASVCSRSRSRVSHVHLTADDYTIPRSRTQSRVTHAHHSEAVVANGIIQHNDAEKIELTRQAFEKLHSDLKKAQQDLRIRDDQCRELTKVRDIVDSEVEELTASLFEEANKMVYEANVGRANAEKKLYEAELKLDGLQAEVAALKLLVLTSTPANPGKKSHRRAPSAGQICTTCETYHGIDDPHEMNETHQCNIREVDSIVFRNFVTWLEDLCPLKDHPFLTLVHKDDIVPCLRFPNEELAKSIYKAIQNNTLTIEAINPPQNRKCSLSRAHLQCGFRVKTSDSGEWQIISSACRSRIVAVVDFLVFLRYIRQGIIKKDVDKMYWMMTEKRADMSLSRLGLQTLDK